MQLLNGDCLEQMKALPDNSVDSIVTDPPYGISFMAKKWDYDVPKVEVWQEAMRVLKPGGHALIACGTRTQHRMVVNIEDAGFEIRDVVSWIYGSGFPKSLNISKAIDKSAGAEREVVGVSSNSRDRSKHVVHAMNEIPNKPINITAPATESAKQWDGWGTALKPACEFFTLARKPLSEKTVAANVLKWGTGGINIDGCRVGTEVLTNQEGMSRWNNYRHGDNKYPCDVPATEVTGRFPANLIHSGEQEVMDLFPETKPSKRAARGGTNANPMDWGNARSDGDIPKGHNDNGGSAARFFYCAKASKKDRDEGLEGFEEKQTTFSEGTRLSKNGDGTPRNQKPSNRNNHPTVKPTALMQYLCRLITPTGGAVLDPYMGSGSTGKAAVKEGFDFVGIELNPDYFNIAKSRIASSKPTT